MVTTPHSAGGGSPPWSRRAFLGAALGAGAGLLLGARRRPPAETLRVGLVLPAGPPGEALRRGVQLGVEEAARTAQLFDKQVELVSAPAGGAPGQAAARLVHEHGVFALVGGTDLESCLALGAAADRLRVLFFNLDCPADSLRGADCHRYAFHIDASAAMRADAVADWLIGSAGARRWFFVHPPTAAGHALYGRARAAMALRGGHDVGNADVADGVRDLRPVLRRAASAGADAMFASLTGPEQLALAAQYRELDPAFRLAGPFLEVAEFRSVPASARAGVWPTLWWYERRPFGAGSLSERYQDRFGKEMDARGWAGWVALKIAFEATLRARTADPTALVSFLESTHAEFDGHKGVPLSFRPWDHQLRQPLYLLQPRPAPPDDHDIFDVVLEVPRRQPGSDAGPVALLDELGDTSAVPECRPALGRAAPSP